MLLEMSPSTQPESTITRIENGGKEGGKEKRLPSVTPRKFNRFFTPRSQGTMPLTSRTALENITSRDASTRNISQSGPLRPFKDLVGQENSPASFARGLKRRKLYHTPEQSPENSDGENSKYKDRGLMIGADADVYHSDQNIPSSPCERALKSTNLTGEEEEQKIPGEIVRAPPKPIRRIETGGLSAQLLQLRIGASPTHHHLSYKYPVVDWQNETSGFYSKPNDVHMTTGVGGPHRVIPFCTASCNTNSLVAVGDEEGQIRLLESTKDGSPNFGERYLAFRVHTNAIIDMVFSEDDSLIATASGDQTARVVDMTTQTTLSILGNHSASLKQVRFQPGTNNNNILATSSRDGCVQIWDLRCKPNNGPRQQFHALVPGVCSPL